MLCISQAAPLPTAGRDVALTAVHYRADIDGLRALAVSAVIAFHAFPRALPGGFIGVDVFFVISGFLITRLIVAGVLTGNFSLGAFYQRRIRCIVPALLVVLLLCGLFGWFALLPREFARLGESMSWCAAFLANMFFASRNDYFGLNSELTPMLHLWSLGVEEQFYILWPVLLLVTMRTRLTSLALPAVVAASLAVSVWGAWHAPPRYFFLLPSRAWELAIGATLGARLARTAALPGAVWRGRALIEATSLMGLALIVGAALRLNGNLAFPGAWGLIPSSGAALLIAAGPAATVNRWLLASRPLVALGKISYPLYLWHWPLFAFAGVTLGYRAPPLLAMMLIIIAIVAAYLTYRLIETPIRRGLPRLQLAGGLLSGLAVVTLLGSLIEGDRIPARLATPSVREWERLASDWHVPLRHEPDGSYTVVAQGRRMRQVLFVGDSHMQQYWSRAQRVVDAQPERARSASFVTYIGCPPLPEVNSTHLGAACNAQFAHAIDVAMSDNVDTVVFGAFWEEYLLGEYAGVRAPWHNDHLYSVRDRLRSPLEFDSPGTRLALEGFRSTVARLIGSGRRVYIVLSNPTSPAYTPLYLLPAAARLSFRSPGRLVIDGDKRLVDATAFEAYVAPLMARLRDIAAQTGATVIDPRAAFCQGMSCPATDANGAPNHTDSNHLTTSYARDHATFIDDILLAPDFATPSRVVARD